MLKVVVFIFYILGTIVAIASIEDVKVDKYDGNYFLSIYAGGKETKDLKPWLALKANQVCQGGYTIVSESLGPYDDKGDTTSYYMWEIKCHDNK